MSPSRTARRQSARIASQRKSQRSRGLRFEHVEDRRMMAGFFSGVFDDIVYDGPMVIELPKAEGSITYDPALRRITIEGTETHNDRVSIVIDTRGTASTADDQVSVLLANINSPLVRAFNLADVSDIVFNGYAGDDSIDNKTIVPLKGYGGAGQDTLLGGFGDDIVLGGPDGDYIDGRRGHDSIWGEGGQDALFGDEGIDMILGGAESDWIHGGHGADSLYGEAGDDWIFGGAATDKIIDNLGNNKTFADYSTNTSTILGYYRFDWFDKNLQDPDLRSAVRLVYRDGFMLRDDLLALFQQVSTDNYVNSAELADLKDLLSTQLTTPVDSRFLLGRVVNGDRANGWYQGSTLGNLFAGASGIHLTKLVDKWFKGGDLPRLATNANAMYGYVSGSLFVNNPTFDDIDQGDANDCYFLAALGEVAQHKPSLIQNMFVDNGDGTFTVRFFKGTAAFYVTVNRYLPIDNNNLRAFYAGWGGGQFDSMNNELWVALAEKAYAQLNESGWISQDGTNTYVGIDFGQPAKAFSHLSGKSAGNTFFGSYSSDLTLKGLLLKDLADGEAITLATKDSGVDSDVVANHAYQLVGYDGQTGLFELYNPHGPGASKPTRLFLSISQLRKNCTYWTSVKL
jgi:hypothetical protein